MSRLTDLIAKAKAKDPQLGADMEREFRALSSRLSFGLNFERHSPEAVELPQCPVRKGNKVRILPPRGSIAKGDQRLWVVAAISRAKKTASLKLLDTAQAETQTVALDDVIVVAEFRDTIYPGLISTGKVARGAADKPCHTVINGENYHVLKALTWTHRGKIDAIYIDPPYNTGAKDWKYNNDYVEGDDQYRHSKWLAMMERRLLIAKQLLNPAGSVLIVTIDEKEYLRLGLLLQQLFGSESIQMVTSVIAPSGQPRGNQMSRVEEYLFLVYVGSIKAGPDTGAGSEQPPEDQDDEELVAVSWESLTRRGTDARRRDRENQFYPILIDPLQRRIMEIGEPLIPWSAPREGFHVPAGLEVVWPIRSDGSEGRWRISNTEARSRMAAGFLRLGRRNATTNRWTVNYLLRSDIARVDAGEIVVGGLADDGSAILRRSRSTTSSVASVPKTVWQKDSHNAGNYGSALLRVFIPKRTFPFPKALYAVEDALRIFVGSKPNAVILDFFSGSGTTAHAVMRLNKQDDGRRQCISVTNNEVAADEQKALREKKLRPGDAEWERWGICDYITKPRVAAAITGKTPDGQPIKGDYKFTDEFPMSDGFGENAEFFTLTYETPIAVSYQTAFTRIAPLLWMRAGSSGPRIDKLPAAGWDVVETYGLLVELDRAADFLKAARKVKTLRIGYIVTDDERRFQALARRLPEGVEPIRLYESYLTNFAFTNGETE